MINFFEELSLNAWPALQTKLYDGWVLRFAEGYTNRSNSISPLYHAMLPLDEKIGNCENEYRKQNLAVTFKLTQDNFLLDQELEKRNYTRLNETSVRLLEMEEYQYRKPSGILIEDTFSEGWFRDWESFANLKEPKSQVIAGNILRNITGEVIVIRKIIDGKTVGCGFGVKERDYIGLYDIIVSQDYRGQGYGRNIIDGILSAAFEKKVGHAYLAVVVGNTAAENLYHSIGFQEIYRYWYRQKIRKK
ncbi:MAG TPA: hypothetical protein DDW50_08550 [Firmicutes bacterium]|jgi:N-acetylglutamate synthase|nr:hypothetical protein [Bacillota bacterium]